MTAVSFTIEKRPDGLIEIQASMKIDTGTEPERRLAGCLHTAVAAAMDEVLNRFQTGVSISKADIAVKAQAACREALERGAKI